MAIASLFYGIVAYLIFLATFLYAIAFVGNLPVPKTIDGGAAGSFPAALVIDVLLLGLFAIQHSVMARPAFKRAWTRIVPDAIERSTYVLFASLALIMLYWQWQPLAGLVWSVQNQAGVLGLQAIFWLGWGVVLIGTFLINHFELFGLQQVYAHVVGKPNPPAAFKAPSMYKWVRHPIYFGFLLAFWATPTMTLGHLLFAVATTGYILIGIWFEERDLVVTFGEQYRRYRREVSMLIPLPRKRTEVERLAREG
ncbi:isoprenylcysteine carboxylmethyltransferase family protein [Bradyrhizobium arachidis]|uniref:methanethiol S-methyltransferase n=1 Tax=Bradyrhizobium TaxID=374 RepID=UPI00188B0FD3|nr:MULTISPECIES: methanethiol S-methyltransferase [Bradyrhizobium]MDN4983957.1 isoprenylcysteine carboxylmethyltransferase family protein [Bradyrhizobium sp. WYCCWR 13022]QOZ51860.1 isoprenylcysteine carboxylmethyltransferase family protein [Bradyrhizobium sp. CCBAU 53338]UVO39034.1 isoprenylcysteine carboxylmethyltransferase family protein [Bradyrhizobium arachidis]